MPAGELQAFTSGCSHPPADLLLAKSDSSTNGADAPALPVLQLVTHARTPSSRAGTPGPPLGAPIRAAPQYLSFHSKKPQAQSASGNLSSSNNKEELVNKEERGSISESIFYFGSGGVECTCRLTAGTGRERKAAGISVREETRS